MGHGQGGGCSSLQIRVNQPRTTSPGPRAGHAPPCPQPRSCSSPAPRAPAPLWSWLRHLPSIAAGSPFGHAGAFPPDSPPIRDGLRGLGAHGARGQCFLERAGRVGAALTLLPGYCHPGCQLQRGRGSPSQLAAVRESLHFQLPVPSLWRAPRPSHSAALSIRRCFPFPLGPGAEAVPAPLARPAGAPEPTAPLLSGSPMPTRIDG